MAKKQRQKPLSERELNRMDRFLERVGPSAMNIEMMDGFLAALICCPETILPGQTLPFILGEDYVFENEKMARDIIGLIVRHWNTIADALADSLKRDEVYPPVFFEDDNGVASGNDWAHGFVQGMQLLPGYWQALINSDEHLHYLMPVMLLHHEHDPDLDVRPPAISGEMRADLLQDIAVSLTCLYRYFTVFRQEGIPAFSRPERGCISRKTGRNAPCPCGSGRKYKHCCAGDVPVLH